MLDTPWFHDDMATIIYKAMKVNLATKINSTIWYY